MKFRWAIVPPDPAAAQRLARDGQLSPLLVQCLLNRGVKTPEAMAGFLGPRLKHLGNPLNLPGMPAAVERLWQAWWAEEPVVVFGDYDVDGISSTALLLEVLNDLGWRVNAYLPHRFEEGYGLSREGVERCLKQFPARLLLAVDCGSTSDAVIRDLQGQGVEVIVLDHHQVSNPPPPALALVNPKAAAESEPASYDLCSVGLAFKLAHALLKVGRDRSIPRAWDLDLRRLLDLVALGTIADLVPLRGENRILAAQGLHRLNQTRRPGLEALIATAQSSLPLGAYEIGFQLGPRLNAAGRLDHAQSALKLLRVEDRDEAGELAAALDRKNRERQQIERSIADELSQTLQEKFRADEDFVIVEGDPSWHPGVIGIVASRISRAFYRPTIIAGGDGRQWQGSGRSIEGFDLAAALRTCDDLLIRHGGHPMAAGLSVSPENLPALRRRLNDLAGRLLDHEQLRPPLYLDAEVALSDLSVELLEGLEQLEPCGQGNPRVLLAARNVWHHGSPRIIGRDEQHVKFRLSDGGAVVEAVWWGGANESWPVGRFDVAFEPRINRFNGECLVQLKLLDWRPA